MATADCKVCKHFHVLELKQSLLKTTDQQSPAVQQFETLTPCIEVVV